MRNNNMLKVRNVTSKNGNVSFFYRKPMFFEAPTVVFINGFGCPSIICEFDKIISGIDDRYGVVGIDYLGTGISEETLADRTIENISSEILAVIENIDNTNLFFCGYSVGGLYLLYVLKETNIRVKGIIGIEPGIPREIDVLEQLSKGLNYINIAENLFLSPATVRKHIENIYTKLQVHNKLEAVQKAKKNNLI